jgi:SAM-dependent methyltransferase
MMKTVCYLCRNPLRPFLHKNGYDVYACGSCGLKSTKLTVPYAQFINEFYTRGYFTGATSHGAYSNYALDEPYITRTMGKFLDKLKIIHPATNGSTPKARLLDIGCAYGYFVEMALRAGYDAYGIDASAHAVNRARQRLNGRIGEETLTSTTFPNKHFDLITMLDVIEHLGDPRKDLQKVANLLTDDGVVLIATGDTDSIAAKILNRRWTFYIPPQHLFFYNRDNFSRLLAESGLVPISWFRVGKWLSLQYVFHLARTTGESKIAQWLYPLMAALPLGRVPLYLSMRDNMVVIAKKKM